MYFAVRAGLEAAIGIGVVAPLIAVGMWRSRARSWPPLFAAIALFALDELVLRVPRMGALATLEWHWQGKFLEVACVFAFVALARNLSLADIGLTAPLRPGWRMPLVVVSAGTLALPVLFLLLLGARDTLTPEGWAFEATMPGIAEELVYRGALLELFDRAMGRPWRIAGAEVGWGALVTSALFGVAHGVAISRTGQLSVEPLLAVGPIIGSLLGAWARRRLDSVVPLMVVHNASNLVIPLASLWLPGPG